MSYWAQRQAKIQDKISVKTIKEINKQFQEYYGRAAVKIIAEFENVYNKLLASQEEGRELSPADLYKLDKYWQAQAQLRKELQKLGEREIATLTKVFEVHFFEIYYSFAIPGKAAFNTIDTQGAQQIINEIWCADGKQWSQRVWDNTNHLAATLNEEFIHIVSTGKKTTDLKNKLQERFNVSYSRANTLVRTEVAHIQTQAAKQRYVDYGLEFYEILGNDDDSCGNQGVDCHKLDGEKFRYSEMRTGVNAPPFHPNCRCAIVPVVDI